MWNKAINDSTSPELRKSSKRAKRFINEINDMKVKQWVSEPTRKENTLDLVMTRHLHCTSVTVKDSRLETDHKETVAEIDTSVIQ